MQHIEVHCYSVHFHFSAGLQFELSGLVGTVREKRERAGMMFMTGRASTTLTAQQCTVHNAVCTVHCIVHSVQSTLHSTLCTMHREVAGGGLSMKMEETVAS